MVFKSKGGQTFSTQAAADAADLRIDTLRKSKSNVVQTTPTKPVTPVTEANLTDPMALEQGATTPIAEKPVIETPTKVETPVIEKSTEVKPVEKVTETKKDEVTPVEDVIEQKKTLEKADYQDDSIERLTQIKQNLDNYATTSPNLFDDYADYKDFFKFDQRSNTQKKLLENAFNQNKYTKLFRGKSVSDIGDMLLSGAVTGNDLQSLNTIDPTVYGAVQDYIKKANDYESANSNITGEGTTGITAVANKLGIEVPQDINLSTEYDKLFNTDEIKNSQTELADKESAINLKKEQLSNIRDTVLKQYEGTGMTTDAIDAIVADKTDNINKELTRMGLEYNNSLTKYNNAIGNATNKYNAIKDQYTINKDKFDTQMKLYEFTYGSFSDRNKDAATDSSKTRTNPITGEAYQYNSATQRYDIPITGGVDSGGVETPISTTLTKNSEGYLNVPRTGNNVGKDTNNFGNITSPTSNSIGMYKSPNGREYAVFATAEDGYNALINDLKAKQSGNTKTGLNANSTVSDLLKKRVGSGVQQSYLNSAAKAAGVNLSDKIGNIDVNKLATGIMAAEGTLDAYRSGGVNLGGLTTTSQQQTPTSTLDPYFKKLNSSSDVSTIMKDMANIAAVSGTPIEKVKSARQDYLNRVNTQIDNTGKTFEDVLKTLSPDAQAIMKGDRTINQLGKTAYSKLSSEIAASGIEDLGLGNASYRGADAKDKKGLQAAAKAFLDLQAIKILGENKSFSEKLFKGLLKGTKIGTDDAFNALSTLTSKNLSTYIKEMSGTAVTKNEADRLKAILPGVYQSKGEFNTNVNTAILEAEEILNNYISTYGFDNTDAFFKAIGIKNTTPELIIQSLGVNDLKESNSWAD